MWWGMNWDSRNPAAMIFGILMTIATMLLIFGGGPWWMWIVLFSIGPMVYRAISSYGEHHKLDEKAKRKNEEWYAEDKAKRDDDMPRTVETMDGETLVVVDEREMRRREL